jgi:hypothetical protein
VQTQVITGTPEPTLSPLGLTVEQIEEVEKNHTIQPITPTEEEIKEYLNTKNGRSNGETE